MFRKQETFVIFADSGEGMEIPLFKFIALKEAVRFIESLSLDVQRKIYYNIDKVAGGVRDSELFKKLDG